MLIETMKDLLIKAMKTFTGKGLNTESHLTRDDVNNLYTVITIATVRGEQSYHISLLVRLLTNLIIIEENINNKPLVDALVQNGIPREQIILACAGEAVPTLG